MHADLNILHSNGIEEARLRLHRALICERARSRAPSLVQLVGAVGDLGVPVHVEDLTEQDPSGRRRTPR